MMDHFIIRYIPGGMSLNHSGWWLVRLDGYWEHPVKMLKKATYAQ